MVMRRQEEAWAVKRAQDRLRVRKAVLVSPDMHSTLAPWSVHS